MVEGRVISVIAVFLKTFCPNFFIFVPRVTVVKDVQSRKQPLPRDVAFRVMEVRGVWLKLKLWMVSQEVIST